MQPLGAAAARLKGETCLALRLQRCAPKRQHDKSECGDVAGAEMRNEFEDPKEDGEAEADAESAA